MPKQLSIPAHIMENRPPNLKEMCDCLGAKPVNILKGQKIYPPKRKRKYPDNWLQLSHSFKEKVGYRCQVCNLQCLRPEDPKEHLTRSEVAKLTLNAHHIDGDTFNNNPDNIFIFSVRENPRFQRRDESNLALIILQLVLLFCKNVVQYKYQH